MKKHLITHEGWFLFCPCWFALEMGKQTSFLTAEINPIPIPKYKLWWLFDLALNIQQFRNWALSFFDIPGGFTMNIKEIAVPFEIEIKEESK